MNHKFTEIGSTLVVSLDGSLTALDSVAFDAVLKRMLRGDAAACVFDLAKLHTIDGMGLGLLVIANDLATKNGLSLRLTNAQSGVREMLDRMMFSSLMAVD